MLMLLLSHVLVCVVAATMTLLLLFASSAWITDHSASGERSARGEIRLVRGATSISGANGSSGHKRCDFNDFWMSK